MYPTDSRPRNRRTVLKLLGSGIALGSVGAGGAAWVATRPANAQATADASLDDATVEMAEGETLDDVLVTGTIEGAYESSADAVEYARFRIDLEYQGTEVAPSEQDHVSRRFGVAVDDSHSGTITRDVELSVLGDTDEQGLDHVFWEPNYPMGIRERSHEWLLTVTFIVYSSPTGEAPSLASAIAKDFGTVTIVWPEDPQADEDSGTVTDQGDASVSISSDLDFEVIK